MEFFFPVDPLDDVRRLYRQACLHRLANESTAAARILQQELPAQVARLQAGDNEGRWSDDTLRSVLAEEYRRVTDAQMVGDLVLRRLQPPAEPTANIQATATAPIASSAVPAETTRAPAPAERPASGPQGIADMLDSMLAQERPRRARA